MSDVRSCVDIEPSRRAPEKRVGGIKRRDAREAMRAGFPSVGSKMMNPHGVSLVIDGYTRAASLSSFVPEQPVWLDLYPVVIPQNLSHEAQDFAAEVDRCTPKALVPLDTLPQLCSQRAHPGGHWVDAWSDPYRVLIFIDGTSLREDIFVHELAHVWIDLVLGIEDHRVLKAPSDTARYSQVQHLQSFVLDQAVNQAMRERGFDTTRIQEDNNIAMHQLTLAASAGYCPPTLREALFIASSLATGMLDAESASDSIVRYSDNLLAIRTGLPDVYKIAQHLAKSVEAGPPVDESSARRAIDDVLTIGFGFTDGGIDLNEELIEVPPAIAWNQDKYPEWFAGFSVRAKCEIGTAMAKLKAAGEWRYELSYAPSARVQMRFQRPDGSWTDYAELQHVTALPTSNIDRAQEVMRINQLNQRRIDEMKQRATNSTLSAHQQTGAHDPNNWMPRMPGRRSYAPGLARFLTQVRMEQLGYEHPYGYALDNPTTYIDPSGLQPKGPSQGLPKSIKDCLSAQAEKILLEKFKNKKCADAIKALCGKGGMEAINDKNIVPSIKIENDCDPGHVGEASLCRLLVPGGRAKGFRKGMRCEVLWMCLSRDMCHGTGRFAGHSKELPLAQACIVLFELGNACSCKKYGFDPGEKGAKRIAEACGCSSVVRPGGLSRPGGE